MTAAVDAAQAALDLQRDLRLSCQWQLARLQAVRDGASLAAAAVQDVRLQLLEQGPMTDVSTVLMVAVVTFVLESPLAGVLTQSFLQRVAQPILRTVVPQAGAVAGEAELLAAVLPSSGGSFASRMTAANQLPSARNVWLRYEAYVKWLDSPAGETTAIAGGKATFAGLQASGANPKAPGTPPGAELLAQVYSWCARHALAVERRHAVLAHWAASSDTNPDALCDVQSVLDTGSLIGLDDLRYRWRILCEACIWATLYAGPLSTIGQAPALDPANAMRELAQFPATVRQLLLNKPSLPERLDERLMAYWVRAFGDFVAEEVSSSRQVTLDTRQDMTNAVLAWLFQVRTAMLRERQLAEKELMLFNPTARPRASLAAPP